MINRYRWYRLQFPRSSQSLSSIIEEHQFSKDDEIGFLNLERNKSISKHRFLWRTEVFVTKFDDSGLPYYEPVENINYVDFALFEITGIFFLRVENPPRSIRELLNTLESKVGLGFTSKVITFEKVKPTSLFASVDSSKLIGLKVAGAVIGEDLVGRMEFASKNGMLIAEMKVLDGIRYTVESAIFELVYEGLKGQVSITSNGMVKLSGQLSPKILSLIEQDLPAIQ